MCPASPPEPAQVSVQSCAEHQQILLRMDLSHHQPHDLPCTPHTKKQSREKRKHKWSPNTYMGLVNNPETFLQLLLSPPQTLHLSNFFLEPSFPSQPALMHLPWTQTEVESGEQGVPSTT